MTQVVPLSHKSPVNNAIPKAPPIQINADSNQKPKAEIFSEYKKGMPARVEVDLHEEKEPPVEKIEMIKEEVDEDHIQMKEERVTKKEKGAKVILTATIQNLIQDQNQKEKSNQTQVSIDIITSKKKQIK